MTKFERMYFNTETHSYIVCFTNGAISGEVEFPRTGNGMIINMTPNIPNSELQALMDVAYEKLSKNKKWDEESK